MGATCRRYAVRVFPLPFYVVSRKFQGTSPQSGLSADTIATYFNQKKNIFIYKQ